MWSLIANVILSGMVIVFLVLMLLIVCVNAMGSVLKAIEKKGDAPPPPSPSAPPPAPKAAPAAAPVSPGITGETVAAISGAISGYMEATAPGVPYTITHISPTASGGVGASASRRYAERPAWGFAGMRQNTDSM